MSYRSIKRVLGESSLERKCRILFGVGLMLLFGGAFFAADRVAERLVLENTRSKATDAIALTLVRIHFVELNTSEYNQHDFSQTADQIASQSGMQDLPLEVYALNDPNPRLRLTFKEPTDLDRRMIDRIRAQLAEDEFDRFMENDDFASEFDSLQNESSPDTASQDGQGATGGDTPPSAPLDFGFGGPPSQTEGIDPVFADFRPSGSGQYVYYQVFEITGRCLTCHNRSDEATPELNRTDETLASTTPKIVVKTVLPDDGTHAAINWIRAILISVAIVTVFLAMLTSYVIVRYVIVKPLRHLRDVSDEISRGKTELRAELQTGDEFEDLAASFNRMLRHLIDTQKELRSVNTDLDKKVDELAQANMRLYEMNQLKGEFLANMSHELRTPLNSIIGFSEVLEGIASLSDRQTRYASNIRKSGRRLLDMINDILDLAKIDAGKMEIKPSTFRIDGVISELVDMVRSLAGEKNIDIQVVTENDLPAMYQDQVKIQQILTNLLSNAIKFTPEGGRITVEAKHIARNRLKLAVSDTGVGIAEEDRAIVFEKFRQGTAVLGHDNLTREYSGTGLGLSIVKELCRLLGGEVNIESEIGKGSIFTVTLPWSHQDEPVRSTDLSTRLDEITKPKRSDFERPRHIVDQVVTEPAASDLDSSENGSDDIPGKDPASPGDSTVEDAEHIRSDVG